MVSPTEHRGVLSLSCTCGRCVCVGPAVQVGVRDRVVHLVGHGGRGAGGLHGLHHRQVSLNQPPTALKKSHGQLDLDTSAPGLFYDTTHTR